jgi:hypothetical protein
LQKVFSNLTVLLQQQKIMPGKCHKCACTEYRWNLVSSAQKLFSGSNASVSADGKILSGQASISGLPLQDNKSDQTAYRNCLCGHHINYHA